MFLNAFYLKWRPDGTRHRGLLLMRFLSEMASRWDSSSCLTLFFCLISLQPLTYI